MYIFAQVNDYNVAKTLILLVSCQEKKSKKFLLKK